MVGSLKRRNSNKCSLYQRACASAGRWQRLLVFLSLDRLTKEQRRAAFQVVVEHGAGRLVDVDVGHQQLFLSQLGLGMDLTIRRDDETAAVLVRHKASVARGKPDGVLG